jgi:hypothetical protein
LPVLSFRHRRSFFAEQNLTSPNASDQTISCRRSKYSSNCCYASWNTPSSVYSLKWHQHVLGDDKNVGNTFLEHWLLIPKGFLRDTSRSTTLGRPPAVLTGGSGNRSLVRSH